jgi:acyl-coenzyme A synthetase/AMP-(fatty) acid ligase
VPSLVSLNLSRSEEPSLMNVSLTMFTGEALTSELAEHWRKMAPISVIDNLYGPVETTVWVTQFRQALGTDMPSEIPLGLELSSVQIQVDKGELIVMGEQVASGYITDHGLEPFNGRYCTGDQVVEQRGKYFFRGRKDQQIKYFGQRIELEAIEAVFLQATSFGAICCVDSKSRLSLVVAEDFDMASAFSFMQERLPPSHVPRTFFHIENWPRSASGKVDRVEVKRLLEAGQLQEVRFENS